MVAVPYNEATKVGTNIAQRKEIGKREIPKEQKKNRRFFRGQKYFGHMDAHKVTKYAHITIITCNF